METTTTKTSQWMIDCDRFIKVGADFEVHDVTNVEDLNYLKLLSATYDLNWMIKGTSICLVRPVNQSVA